MFHVSKVYLGSNPVLSPRLPVSASKKEGNIPRICVSPNIFFCVRAIVGSPQRKLDLADLSLEFADAENTMLLYGAVYKTNEKPFIPPDCSDFRSNKEHWFIKDTVFTYCGSLDFSNIHQGKLKLKHDNEPTLLQTRPKGPLKYHHIKPITT